VGGVGWGGWGALIPVFELRCSTTWVIPPALLCFSYFQVECCIFAWGQSQTMVLLPTASHVAGMTGEHHHTWLECWDEDFTFRLVWLQTLMLLISAFWVAGITGTQPAIDTWSANRTSTFKLPDQCNHIINFRFCPEVIWRKVRHVCFKMALSLQGRRLAIGKVVLSCNEFSQYLHPSYK
jgi:hypothetical protein